MIWVNCWRCFSEHSFALALEIVELPAMQCPGEHAQDAEQQHRGDRDQQVQDVHGLAANATDYRDRRSEFITTNSELVAMPSPAAQGGSQPTSASGTQAAL